MIISTVSLSEWRAFSDRAAGRASCALFLTFARYVHARPFNIILQEDSLVWWEKVLIWPQWILQLLSNHSNGKPLTVELWFEIRSGHELFVLVHLVIFATILTILYSYILSMQALTFHSSKCIKLLHRLTLELYLRCLQVATKGFFF